MTNSLSPDDRSVLDTVMRDAVEECRAAGLTDETFIASVATELGTMDIWARKSAGDLQAERILFYLICGWVEIWLEHEAASGRPALSNDEAVRRILRESAAKGTPA